MKKLLFTLVGAATFAALAADPAVGDNIDVLGFENFDLTNPNVTGAVINRDDYGLTGTSKWSCSGDDASLVKTYNGENAAEPTGVSFPAPFEDAGNQYLALDTNGSELQRAIPAANRTVAADGTYIDTLVQFTPSESAPTAADLTDAKLAIWLGVEENVTNLYVQGGYYDANWTLTSKKYALTATKPILPGTWYRLTVKAIPDITGGQESIPGFKIFLDGAALSGEKTLDADLIEDIDTEDDEIIADLENGRVFASLSDETVATLTAVGFKGTGALDDFVVTTEAPEFGPSGIDFTLTWPSGVTAVSYTIDGGTPVAISGTSPVTINGVAAGSTVAFTFQNDDGATKTKSVEVASGVTGIDATGETFGWPEYLGAAVDGAYTIDDANDLDMLRKGVAASLPTVGETFKQTANIDMASAGAFAGIGTYAANLNSGVAFCGTYDGQNYKISNVDFTQRNYGGVFNQVKGGTIKNLTVENITCSTFSSSANSGEWGCSIIGNAGLGATLQNLTAMGSFGTAATPCTHNVAGIAIRVCGGASNVVNGVTMLETLVKDCTNNATLYGSYTKCAGITALTQDQNGVPNDYVLYDSCVNNANIAMVAGKGTEGRDGLAGIVAYVADSTKMQNCVNNASSLTSVLANAKIGGLVGWAQGRTLDDLGGNTVPAAQKMIGDQNGSTITGFKYAKVADNKATTATTLAKDTTYLLEGNVAASATPVFTLAAAGDTIAFDTSLGYTFAGTVDGAAAVVVTDATADNVTTYTAATAVAQITGGAKFTSLQAAVDAATAGDTVTVLADCTISTPLSIAKNLTIHNDYTITGAVDYAICIGATVSFEGSGKIERASNISGSAFCVGANENARGAITVGTAGTLNFTGLTVCGGNGGNLIKLENGTVNMNGGVLKDGKRGIKADADAGSYTSAIVINGGTITNNTDCAVMASAESANGTATVTINGGVISGALVIDKKVGTYSITIPGTSTAMFNADQTAFCASGYETTDGDSDGWYTVTAVQSAGWVDDSSTITAGTKASEQYSDLAGTALADADAKELTDWAKAKSIDFSAAVANAGDYVEAFLLNCAVADVENEKDAFVLNITIGADGTPSVALPAGKDYNGKLQMKGSTDLNTWTDVESASKNYQFYKYILSL